MPQSESVYIVDTGKTYHDEPVEPRCEINKAYTPFDKLEVTQTTLNTQILIRIAGKGNYCKITPAAFSIDMNQGSRHNNIRETDGMRHAHHVT